MEIINSKDEVILESPPHFLLYTIKVIPKPLRSKFPILSNLEIKSNKYIDETQVLLENEVHRLRDEILIIKQLVNNEYFIDGLDNKKLSEFLLGKSESEKKESVTELDLMIKQIQVASENKLKIRILL
ncbi:MAG: hypothetical protein JXR05_17020 [Flavobacteriaceae bacterium]